MTRAPLLVVKPLQGSGQTWKLSVWPKAPKSSQVALPTFCPQEHRKVIIENFQIHLHQHPAIPFIDGTHLTAEEIHEGAVSNMYTYCFMHDLSQVWAYLWNCWYNIEQWPLWARSTCPSIPRLKMTMITESTWWVIKHQDLKHFSQPRLDLVVHVIISQLLPHITYNLNAIMGQCQIG